MSNGRLGYSDGYEDGFAWELDGDEVDAVYNGAKAMAVAQKVVSTHLCAHGEDALWDSGALVAAFEDEPTPEVGFRRLAEYYKGVTAAVAEVLKDAAAARARRNSEDLE